ncbi:spherulin-1B [Elysia marginata]|uniref:Spherulin-1B n=1 Tax=Elysia marginata TaxID=1093978 RepID=A0AAV4F3Y1_9GAST|nr:spherulin-1B [Elysia marginata]
MDVGNPELTRDDEITTIKRRPPKRVNKAKERKKSLNYGEEYITNRGKTVAARSLGISCNQNTCKIRCKDKVSQDQRLVIPKVHWGLGQSRMRWDKIAKTVNVIAPKFWRTGTFRQKETSRVYTFTVNDEEVTVCKKFYLHILSIAETLPC